MSHSDLRQLLLKEKPTDTELSAVGFYFAFAEESILKIFSPKARNLVSLPLEGEWWREK